MNEVVRYFPAPEDENIVERANEIVDEYLYFQINGKEGWFTALSAAAICHCKRCLNELASYIRFDQGEPPAETNYPQLEPHRRRKRRRPIWEDED